MKKCDICGRETNRTYRTWGYTLCAKHMHQYHKYGKFLDNNPRTNNDLNDYIIKDDIATFNIYNQKNEKCGEFIIDSEDVEKVKYHKWRFSHNHVVTGLPAKHNQRDLSHIILDVKPNGLQDFVVDHINGNGYDNRKCNLRICSQGENMLNKSFSRSKSTYCGVSFRENRNKWDPEIRYKEKRCHLGYVDTLEEAVYKRKYAETLLFKEFSNKEEQNRAAELCKNLSDSKKQELETVVITKLKAKKLWQ